MNIKIKVSQKIKEKLLYKHHVTLEEVSECIENRTRGILKDTREKHQTEPPTRWFVASTDKGRLLKVVFIGILMELMKLRQYMNRVMAR